MLGIYFFTYLRRTKLLATRIFLPYASLYRIHQNCIYQVKSALPADWYNNCCVRYIFFSISIIN